MEKKVILIVVVLLTIFGFGQTYAESIADSEKQIFVTNPSNSTDSKIQINFESQLVGIILGQKDTVSWINNGTSHIEIIGNGWGTSRIDPGQSASVKFNSTGIYPYESNLHTWKKGIVIVVDSYEITFDNIEQRTQMTHKIIEHLGDTQFNIKNSRLILDGINQVIVELDKDEFTTEKTAQYYEKKIKDWIPFETRISIAMHSDSNSQFTNQGGMSSSTDPIKFLEDSLVFSGTKYKRLVLSESLDDLGNNQATKIFEGIKFNFFKAEVGYPNQPFHTKILMEFPDGTKEEIFAYLPTKHIGVKEDNDNAYFSFSNNPQLPTRVSILSLDDDVHPTSLLIFEKNLSLTEQYNLGVLSKDAYCKPDLQRYEKNNELLCIKELTFYKILQRGYFDSWQINNINLNYYSDFKISDIALEDKSLKFTLDQANEDGILAISLPKKLLDAKDNFGKKISFRLLYDEKIPLVSHLNESNQDQTNRNLEIFILKHIKVVEIIGTD